MSDVAQPPEQAPQPLTNDAWKQFFDEPSDKTVEPILNTLVGNRYQLLEVLGAGGMAVTFKALDTELNRFRAVKMPRWLGTIDRDELLRRFEREIERLDKLAHDYVVKHYDHKYDGSGETPSYLVMAFVDGFTLEDHLVGIRTKGWIPFTCHQAAEIVEKVGQVIAHLHSHNLLHRDIKPDNIMLEINEDAVTPILIDLGIMKDQDEDSSLTTTNALGALKYMSPEQKSGKRGSELTYASDQYALATTIRDMFPGGSIQYVSGLRPFQQEKIDQLLKKAERTEPDERYKTVTDLTTRVAKALRTESAIPTYYYIGGAIAVVVVAMLVLVMLLGGGSSDAKEEANALTATPMLIATSTFQASFPANMETPLSLPTSESESAIQPSQTAKPLQASNTPFLVDTPTPTSTNTPKPSVTPTTIPTTIAPSATATPTPVTPTPVPATFTPTIVPTSTYTMTPVFDSQDVYTRLSAQTRSISRFDCDVYDDVITEIIAWASTATTDQATDVRAFTDDDESAVMIIYQYCQDNPGTNLPIGLSYEFAELDNFVTLFEGE